jgi:hypothetical protein
MNNVNTEASSGQVRFIPNAPAYAMCMICDTKHAPGTESCPKCHSPLSAVRTCPDCGRVVSAKHLKCVYCSLSFVLDESIDLGPQTAPVPVTETDDKQLERRRAILVSVGVFLIVVLIGLATTIMRSRPSSAEYAAETYAIHAAPLRLQASLSAGTAETVQAGTVLRLTKMELDPQGRRWFVVQREGAEEFVSLNDVAPPKVHQTEAGSQMLRAWLLSLSDPDLVTESLGAVNYFCAQNVGSARCEELRWVLAERLRSMSQKSGSPELAAKSREILKSIADGKGKMSSEASKTLDNADREEIRRPVQPKTGASKKKNGANAGREYALIDRAEVQVRVPNLKSVAKGAILRTPVAREIKVNEQIAVPSDAICVLQVIDADPARSTVTLQLTGIEFGGKRYNVSTTPQRVNAPGAVVVFPLNSALLINH